jgi:hypothetical protein
VDPAGGRTAGPTMQPLMGWLHDDTLHEAVEGNPKLKVGGGQTPWLPDQVAISNPSLDPYNTPLLVEIKATHSTCSSPLVKVLV